ncbi:hypothetical protein CTI14_68945, partial [Methylobacterium radiotolerans]
MHWHKPFTQVLDWSNPPFAKWFDDGELNVAYNCLDRHVEAGNGELVHWHKPFTQVLDWSNPPFAKWFDDGELNVA